MEFIDLPAEARLLAIFVLLERLGFERIGKDLHLDWKR